MLTYALAGLSGANFNPAVTLALYCSKALGGPGVEADVLGVYVVAQLLGGLLSGFCFVGRPI